MSMGCVRSGVDIHRSRILEEDAKTPESIARREFAEAEVRRLQQSPQWMNTIVSMMKKFKIRSGSVVEGGAAEFAN